jgi:hypothetical protein
VIVIVLATTVPLSERMRHGVSMMSVGRLIIFDELRGNRDHRDVCQQRNQLGTDRDTSHSITQSYANSCTRSVGDVATGGRALDHQKQVAASQTGILATCR